ncbi:MAG: UDP-N-acetylmuramoyl-L-alanine--D-glutamate ligase [Chthoniobacterales bacterium]|nr:UDP-N-acetylmuramoyl-L-alanine--D-glutamate ligase [Chthoniobacterales bacterium]
MKRERPGLPHGVAGVIGVGKSARGVVRLLQEKGREVEVLVPGGVNEWEEGAKFFYERGVVCRFGEEAQRRAKELDWGVLSPGVSRKKDLPQGFLGRGATLLSEVEVAWRCSRGIVVAITGTNGKTTTTTLTSHLLRGGGWNAVACGNIGYAYSDAVRENPEAEVFVVEVSSFQLETCYEFSPDVAVWLNFSPNHLDWYESLEEYREAKLRIFRSQKEEDLAIVQKESRPEGLRSRVVTFSSRSWEADFVFKDGFVYYNGNVIVGIEGTKLVGKHNGENLAASLGVIWELNRSFDGVFEALKGYNPPEHRCEYAEEIRGVKFVNDSKSTNLDALRRALESIDEPIVLIAGGKDKGIRYREVVEEVRKKVKCAVLIGEVRGQIAEDWEGVECRVAESLSEAVEKAYEMAEPGWVVLFSPGTSSYDMFRDYEERGIKFKEVVKDLKLKLSKRN